MQYLAFALPEQHLLILEKIKKNLLKEGDSSVRLLAPLILIREAESIPAGMRHPGTCGFSSPCYKNGLLQVELRSEDFTAYLPISMKNHRLETVFPPMEEFKVVLADIERSDCQTVWRLLDKRRLQKDTRP